MRRRLVLAIAGVAAAAVVLFALPLAITLKRSYEDDELLKLQRDTVASTREIDLAAQGGDPVELPDTGDRLAVYDRLGHRVAGSGPARAPALVDEALSSGRLADQSPSGRLEVAVPLLHRERVSGAVLAVRSDSGVADRTRRAWLALAGLAAAIVALAAGAALLLGRRLASPLERLAAAARRLGDGDFTVRVPRSGVPEADAIAAALEGTAGRLDELLTRERSFSSDASHQLRTPLAALRLELEALELRGDSSAEVARALDEVERLQRTIEALLAAARDTSRRDETADLAEVLRGIEARWHGPLAALGRPLWITFDSDGPQVSASATVVAEVLQVLLDNAATHGSGEVSVVARDASGSVAVDVSDQGSGLDTDLETLFERRPVTEDGHGIGLALARTLARAEGGELRVTRSGPNPVLTLFLPRAEP